MILWLLCQISLNINFPVIVLGIDSIFRFNRRNDLPSQVYGFFVRMFNSQTHLYGNYKRISLSYCQPVFFISLYFYNKSFMIILIFFSCSRISLKTSDELDYLSFVLELGVSCGNFSRRKFVWCKTPQWIYIDFLTISSLQGSMRPTGFGAHL